MRRWVFRDPAVPETWTVPMNPRAMDSPRLVQQTTTGGRSPIDSRIRVLRSPRMPKEWRVDGFIRTKAHHDELLRWSKKSGRLEVTDHYGRIWSVRFVSCDMADRRPTPRVPWRMQYAITFLSYGQVGVAP